MKDSDIAGRGHFSSPLVSSVGMKGRALFLPDISLTACRYLSVLIRAVAGPVWLLPGCESNHTSSSPLSLIYREKNSLAHIWRSLRGRCQEKMEFPAASQVCTAVEDMMHMTIQAQERFPVYLIINISVNVFLFVHNLKNSIFFICLYAFHYITIQYNHP